MWAYIFISLVWMPEINIDGSYEKWIFNSEVTVMHFHLWYIRVPVTLHPHQHMKLSFFLNLEILLGVQVYLSWLLLRFVWWLVILSICSYWPFINLFNIKLTWVFYLFIFFIIELLLYLSFKSLPEMYIVRLILIYEMTFYDP